jgi:molybdopterin converting factor small subunit
MMQITIEYTAQLRRAAGISVETLEVAETVTLLDVARAVVSRRGDELGRLLLDAEGRLQRSVLTFVQDEQVSADSPAPLCDGQTVTFAAPISGG